MDTNKEPYTSLPSPPPTIVGRRAVLAAVVEFLVNEIDLIDGDPDLEANGDELDGSMGEDDFCFHSTTDWGAGCPVSDPGGGNVTDERHDACLEDGL